LLWSGYLLPLSPHTHTLIPTSTPRVHLRTLLRCAWRRASRHLPGNPCGQRAWCRLTPTRKTRRQSRERSPLRRRSGPLWPQSRPACRAARLAGPLVVGEPAGRGKAPLLLNKPLSSLALSSRRTSRSSCCCGWVVRPSHLPTTWKLVDPWRVPSSPQPSGRGTSAAAYLETTPVNT
jgi:hypothetical protein